MTVQEKLKPYTKEIIKLYLEGWSTTKIGKKYNTNNGNIYVLLINNNIKPRKLQKFKGNIDDYKEEIIKDFDNGVSGYQISQKLGIAQSTINRALKRYGKNTSKNRTFNPDNLIKDRFEEIKKMHLEDKMTAEEISKKIGCGNSTIWKLLTKHNIYINYQYKINEEYFTKINTEDKAYFLGLMYADGNVAQNCKSFRISLVEKDKHILETFIKYLNYEGNLRFINKEIYRKKHMQKAENAYELTVCKTKMAQDLNALGCGPAKSLVLEFPSDDIVPKNLKGHFIRGVFDGDGSIANISNGRAGCIGFSGSHKFIMELNNYIIQNKICNPTGIYQRYKNKPCEKSAHMLQICKIEDKQKFLEWLYKDIPVKYELCLHRKRQLAKDLYGI